MSNEYYYLGKNLAMTKIHGSIVFKSKSYVVIDTNSWESLIYAQGHPVEPDQISVLERFLSPGDVFLDIGANVGLYTAVAGEIVGVKGKTFSFEANPHTFSLLKKTAQANRLFFENRHQLVNTAVSNRSGTTQFSYRPDHLGGGGIVENQKESPDRRLISVNMITLDEFLPKDITVDFAKIDVEGHELEVIQGMSEVIARSPNIRLIVEHFTDSDVVSAEGKAVLDYIRSLGLTICRIRPKGRLELLEDDTYPTGNVYLFATRYVKYDQDRSLNSRVIKPRGLYFHSTANDGTDPVREDGTFVFDSGSDSQSHEKVLFFGPYCRLEQGSYVLRFIRAHGNGAGRIALAFDGARSVVHECIVYDWSRPIHFSVPHSIDDFEVILRRHDISSLDFAELEIERVC